MPEAGETAKFPAALVALADLGGPYDNFARLTLNGDHNNAVTAIVVNEVIPATWPQAGWLTCESEIMRYTAWAVKTFTVAARDASLANSQGTAAAAHVSSTRIGRYLTEQSYNQLEAELIALERMFFKDASVNWTGAVSIDWSTGGLFKPFATTGNVTGITMTNGQIGQPHTIEITYGGAHTVAFTTTVKWSGGVGPTFTSVNTKKDIVTLIWDGTDWLGTFVGNF